jgi:tetratricopeptide (TPR) repeat protein
LKSYETLIDAHPENEQALDAAAKAAAMRFEKKDYERALRHLGVLKRSPDPAQTDWATQMAGKAWFALGRYREAFDIFQTVLPKVQEPKARESMIWKLAVSAHQTKQDKEALRYLELWLKSNQEDGDENRSTQRVDALKMLASVQTRLGLMRELVDTWAKLEATLPSRPDAPATTVEKAALSANQGLVLFRLKDYAGAEKRFRHWLSRYPDAKNRPEVLLHLGLAELRIGKNAEAGLHLDSFVSEFPSHPQASEALYASALGYLRGKEYSKSTERLERWLAGAKGKNSPERVREAWFLLAATYEKAENWKEAASSYHQILTLYPQDPQEKAVFHRLTAFYDRLSLQAGSEETFRWLEERHPDRELRGRIFLQLGKKHLLRKEWDRAIQHLRDAVRSPEEFVKGEGYYRLARIYVHQGKHREALEAMAKVPASVHDQADWKAEADYIQGVAYEGEKDWEMAIQSYRVAARSALTAPVARAALNRISRLESRRWNQ